MGIAGLAASLNSEMFHVKHQSWFNEGMESLVIRPLVEQDLARHAEIMGDSAVVRYLYEDPLSRSEAEAHLSLRLATGPAGPGEWRNFAVDLGGHLIGEVGFVLNSVTHREAEVGYFFDPAFGGKGFATSAVATLVDWCFSELHAHRVVGRLDARNQRSALLLERLRFTAEGRFRENEFVKGEWTDELVYAVLEHEWEVVRPTLTTLVPVVFHVKHPHLPTE